jgi:hypothetical protein
MQRSTMTPRTWLVFLLTYACVALALDAWAISRWERIVDPTVAGSLGARFITSDGRNNLRIASLSADSPLMAAGAEVGNLIKFDLRTDLSRFFAQTDTVGLTLYHGDASRHLNLSPTSRNVEPVSVRVFFLNWAGNIIGILCGMLLAMRRSDPGPHRVLAVLLVTGGFGSELHGLPHPFHDLYFRFLYPLLLQIGWLSFPFFAMVFPADAQLIRRTWPRRVFFMLVAWLVLPAILKVAGREGLLPAWWTPNAITTFMEATAGFACVVCGFAWLWISWRRSGAATRQAVEWIAFSLGLCHLGHPIAQ